MKLIDADEIRWADHYDSDGNLSKYKIAYSDEMPPTVDAVPVIRCNDCKWNNGGEWVDCYMSGMHGRTSNKNYCSRAERRER